MSTTDNTLQNYIIEYIEKKFAAHTGNRYDKLYRELLSGVEEIIKLTVSKVKHYDNLENLHNDSRKKFIHAFAKHQVLEFLKTHQKKMGIVEEFNNEHSLNESDLKILKEGKDLVSKINDISLIQQNENGKEVNIRTTLAQSIHMPHKLEHSRQ